MAELSPVAQAVLDAVPPYPIHEAAIAAALRALDSQLGHEVLGVRCVDCSQIQLVAAELEACCEWAAEQDRDFDLELRAARRPKPPSLKEQALAVLDDASDRLDAAHENILRRALEQLDG